MKRASVIIHWCSAPPQGWSGVMCREIIGLGLVLLALEASAVVAFKDAAKDIVDSPWSVGCETLDRVRNIPSNLFTFIDLQYTFMLQSFGLVRSNTLKQPVMLAPSAQMPRRIVRSGRCESK